MNLWDATERIGVLYVLFGLCDDFTAFQYSSECGSGFYLAFMRTHLLDTVHERIDAAVKGFQGDGGNEVGFLGKTEGFEYGIHSVGTHKLGTIEQGQSFFAFQFDWFPTKLIKHADSFAAFTFIIHIAYADQRKEEIGERGKIS